jgi:transposase
MGQVIIGMDPHKRSATIEIIDDREQVLAQGRFDTDTEGYQAMLKLGRQHKDWIWAVEGCNGIGRHIAQRLVADGEPVVDVPSKLSARARVFASGQGRKTDPVDAHSVAVVALRTKGLRHVVVDDTTVALRLLVDRRDTLGLRPYRAAVPAAPSAAGAGARWSQEVPVRAASPCPAQCRAAA